MRTTVRLDDELLTAAKQRAAAQQTTLTALIEDSLRHTLDAGPAGILRTQPFGDETTPEGIDPCDPSLLRELMDNLLR